MWGLESNGSSVRQWFILRPVQEYDSVAKGFVVVENTWVKGQGSESRTSPQLKRISER